MVLGFNWINLYLVLYAKLSTLTLIMLHLYALSPVWMLMWDDMQS